MTTTHVRYQYPLASLETLYAHRLEQARLLLAAAQQRLDDHQARIRQLRLALSRSHGDWNGTQGRAMRFDPASHAAAREVFATRQKYLEKSYEMERSLHSDLERCRDDLTRAHRCSETVRRHKQRAVRDFNQASARAHQRMADDDWPLRGGRHDGF